jgi:GDA1/CD39 (nucleoside phosphatase) family
LIFLRRYFDSALQAVNFLLGDLVEQSEGAGTVVNPRTTHGALDLGGASTQISFYEPAEDIMSNLFKFQLGQAKHWNIYAHSFLMYGMNEAIDRFHASLIANRTLDERMIQGVYNPCLPVGGPSQRHDVRTNIHFTAEGVETWDYQEGLYPSGDGYFQAVLVNDRTEPDVDLCFEYAGRLLHREQNHWCNFAHKGDCSFAGIYQPALPRQSNDDGNGNFGEFVAFSNYYHIWQFLHLPERATIAQLEAATRHVCSLSHQELIEFIAGVDIGDNDDGSAELDSYCFRSAYAYHLLHRGYGFTHNDTVRATRVIEGQKVGWALGAMLYEINAMPWTYNTDDKNFSISADDTHLHMAWETVCLLVIALGMVLTLLIVFWMRERSLRRLYRDQYEPVKEVVSLPV